MCLAGSHLDSEDHSIRCLKSSQKMKFNFKSYANGKCIDVTIMSTAQLSYKEYLYRGIKKCDGRNKNVW